MRCQSFVAVVRKSVDEAENPNLSPAASPSLPRSDGHQAALPSSAFLVLQEEFKLTAEIFSSPLNVHEDNCLYSLFHDTDKSFGSLGNFFAESAEEFCSKWASGGCFECNPPFVLHVR